MPTRIQYKYFHLSRVLSTVSIQILLHFLDAVHPDIISGKWRLHLPRPWFPEPVVPCYTTSPGWRARPTVINALSLATQSAKRSGSHPGTPLSRLHVGSLPPHFIGTFPISCAISPTVVRLYLPPPLRHIHLVFHVSRVKSCVASLFSCFLCTDLLLWKKD